MTVQRLINKIMKNNKNIKVLIIGLDNCGKTSLLYKMFGKSICDVAPTFGYSLFSVEYFFRRKYFYNRLVGEKCRNGVYYSKGKGGIERVECERVGIERVGIEGVECERVNIEEGIENIIQNTKEEETEENIEISTKEENIKRSTIEENIYCKENKDIYNLTIVDVGGQSLFRKYWSSYYEKVDGVVFVYDLSDNRKYEELLEEIVNDVELEGVPIVVMGNKCDLVDIEHVESSCDKYGSVRFVCTSALTGKNVKNGFEWLLSTIIANK